MEQDLDRYAFERPDPELGEVVDFTAQQLDRRAMDPEDQLLDWVETNVWSQGLTVDQLSGEIIDPETGTVVGMVPRALLAALPSLPSGPEEAPEGMPTPMPEVPETGTIDESSLTAAPGLPPLQDPRANPAAARYPYR